MVHKKIFKLPKEKTLTLLIGIPAVGKTYIAKKMKEAEPKRRVIISSDKIRRKVLNSKETKVYFDNSKEGEVWSIVEEKVQEALINPEIIECVLDAVNMNYFGRDRFIQMAKEHGIHTRGIIIYKPLKKIKKWNINRKYPISESVLITFFKNFTPPVQEEFDELLTIGSLKKFQREREKLFTPSQ